MRSRLLSSIASREIVCSRSRKPSPRPSQISCRRRQLFVAGAVYFFEAGSLLCFGVLCLSGPDPVVDVVAKLACNNRGVRVGNAVVASEPAGRLCYVDVVPAGGGGSKEGRSLSCLRCVARPLTGFVRRNCIVRDGIYPRTYGGGQTSRSCVFAAAA